MSNRYNPSYPVMHEYAPCIVYRKVSEMTPSQLREHIKKEEEKRIPLKNRDETKEVRHNEQEHNRHTNNTPMMVAMTSAAYYGVSR